MELYYICILFLFIFSVNEVFSKNKIGKRNALICSYILLVILIGTRWETGTDWYPYLNAFEDSSTFENAIKNNERMEKGYLASYIIIKQLTNDYSYYLLFHAMFFYFMIIKSFKYLTPFPQTALLIFFCFNLGIVGSNRQLLAVGICMIALCSFIIEREKRFFGLILAATFFHTTALFFSVYFFLKRNFDKRLILLAILLAIIIGKMTISIRLFSLAGQLGGFATDKFDLYMGSAKESMKESSLSSLGLFKRLLFVGAFIYYRDSISNYVKHYNLMLNGYIVGLLIYFLFSSSLLIMVNRGSLYFSIMEALLLSSFLTIIVKPIDKFLFLIVITVISIVLIHQSIAAYFDLFDPYKSWWYNTNYYRRMY